MAKQYKTKPVTIEAMELNGGSVDDVMKWIDDYGGLSRPLTGGRLLITTLEGDMIAGKGDFIIKGLANEFYPCKAEIFKQKYEEIEDTEET